MKLADKPCYPAKVFENAETLPNVMEVYYPGITFKERLIIALASNPEMMLNDDKDAMQFDLVALGIVEQADAIIKEMESI